MKRTADAVALADRWKSDLGQTRSQAVIRALRRGDRLGSLGFVEQRNGRWDLRGLELPGARILDDILEGRRGPQYAHWRTELTGRKLVGLDLSYADVSEAVFERCLVEDVILDHAKCVNWRIAACRFRRVSLTGADLRSAAFLGAPEAHANTFEDVLFDCADLRHSHHSRSKFTGCSFRHTRLSHVDFMASSFVRCKFVGKLQSVWFRGHYPNPRFLKEMGQAEHNPMQEVDFSEATLRCVLFVNGVDLSAVVLPASPDHVVVRDPGEAYLRARQIVAETWTEPDRSAALFVIEILARPDQRGQALDIVNRRDLAEFAATGLGLAAQPRAKVAKKRDATTEESWRVANEMAMLLVSPCG